MGCGVSPDGRLAVSEPQVRTEYRDVATKRFVGCHALDGLVVHTRLRVGFSASGHIASAVVRLVGHTSSAQDNVFQSTFFAGDGTLVSSGVHTYSALFEANPLTGHDLPTRSTDASTLDVTAATRTVVDVAVHDLDRVGGTFGGFVAHVTGRSDTGAAAYAPNSDLVPVYYDCTFVRRTSEHV